MWRKRFLSLPFRFFVQTPWTFSQLWRSVFFFLDDLRRQRLQVERERKPLFSTYLCQMNDFVILQINQELLLWFYGDAPKPRRACHQHICLFFFFLFLSSKGVRDLEREIWFDPTSLRKSKLTATNARAFGTRFVRTRSSSTLETLSQNLQTCDLRAISLLPFVVAADFLLGRNWTFPETGNWKITQICTLEREGEKNQGHRQRKESWMRCWYKV